MRKVVTGVIILTLFFVCLPFYETKQDELINEVSSETNVTKDEDKKKSFDVTFIKTYYTAKDNVIMYPNSKDIGRAVAFLGIDEPVAVYREENGNIYCEDDEGHLGWIQNNTKNLKDPINKKTTYKIDINVTDKIIIVFCNDTAIKRISCQLGSSQQINNYIPIGNFVISERQKCFDQYNIKFFSNYSIFSMPESKKGNIIKEENGKQGNGICVNSIGVSSDNLKWIYDYVTDNSLVCIHY